MPVLLEDLAQQVRLLRARQDTIIDISEGGGIGPPITTTASFALFNNNGAITMVDNISQQPTLRLVDSAGTKISTDTVGIILEPGYYQLYSAFLAGGSHGNTSGNIDMNPVSGTLDGDIVSANTRPFLFSSPISTSYPVPRDFAWTFRVLETAKIVPHLTFRITSNDTVGDALWWFAVTEVGISGIVSPDAGGGGGGTDAHALHANVGNTVSLFTSIDRYTAGTTAGGPWGLRAARGTEGAPTRLQANDVIGTLAYGAYATGVGFRNNSAQIQTVATEIQDATHGGTEMRFQTTLRQPGSSTSAITATYNAGSTYNDGNRVNYSNRVWQAQADGLVGITPGTVDTSDNTQVWRPVGFYNQPKSAIRLRDDYGINVGDLTLADMGDDHRAAWNFIQPGARAPWVQGVMGTGSGMTILTSTESYAYRAGTGSQPHANIWSMFVMAPAPKVGQTFMEDTGEPIGAMLQLYNFDRNTTVNGATAAQIQGIAYTCCDQSTFAMNPYAETSNMAAERGRWNSLHYYFPDDLVQFNQTSWKAFAETGPGSAFDIANGNQQPPNINHAGLSTGAGQKFGTMFYWTGSAWAVTTNPGPGGTHPAVWAFWPPGYMQSCEVSAKNDFPALRVAGDTSDFRLQTSHAYGTPFGGGFNTRYHNAGVSDIEYAVIIETDGDSPGTYLDGYVATTNSKGAQAWAPYGKSNPALPAQANNVTGWKSGDMAAIVTQGAWSSATDYDLGDLVTEGGHLYHDTRFSMPDYDANNAGVTSYANHETVRALHSGGYHVYQNTSGSAKTTDPRVDTGNWTDLAPALDVDPTDATSITLPSGASTLGAVFWNDLGVTATGTWRLFNSAKNIAVSNLSYNTTTKTMTVTTTNPHRLSAGQTIRIHSARPREYNTVQQNRISNSHPTITTVVDATTFTVVGYWGWDPNATARPGIAPTATLVDGGYVTRANNNGDLVLIDEPPHTGSVYWASYTPFSSRGVSRNFLWLGPTEGAAGSAGTGSDNPLFAVDADGNCIISGDLDVAGTFTAAGSTIAGPAWSQATQTISNANTALDHNVTAIDIHLSADFTMTHTPAINLGVAGERMVYVNTSTHSITLQDDSTLGGTNLFLGNLANDLTLAPFDTAEFVYINDSDPTKDGWYLVAGTSMTGGSGLQGSTFNNVTAPTSLRSSTTAPSWRLERTGGALSVGDLIGTYTYDGHDGTGLHSSAITGMYAYADEDFSVGNTGTSLVVETTNVGDPSSSRRAVAQFAGNGDILFTDERAVSYNRGGAIRSSAGIAASRGYYQLNSKPWRESSTADGNGTVSTRTITCASLNFTAADIGKEIGQMFGAALRKYGTIVAVDAAADQVTIDRDLLVTLSSETDMIVQDIAVGTPLYIEVYRHLNNSTDATGPQMQSRYFAPRGIIQIEGQIFFDDTAGSTAGVIGWQNQLTTRNTIASGNITIAGSPQLSLNAQYLGDTNDIDLLARSDLPNNGWGVGYLDNLTLTSISAGSLTSTTPYVSVVFQPFLQAIGASSTLDINGLTALYIADAHETAASTGTVTLHAQTGIEIAALTEANLNIGIKLLAGTDVGIQNASPLHQNDDAVFAGTLVDFTGTTTVDFSDPGVTIDFTGATVTGIVLADYLLVDGSYQTAYGAAYDVGLGALSATTTAAPWLLFAKRSNNTFASPTAVAADDNLAVYEAAGYNSGGTPGFHNAASISLVADENFTVAGSSAGRIELATTATGSTTPTLRASINSLGILNVGSSASTEFTLIRSISSAADHQIQVVRDLGTSSGPAAGSLVAGLRFRANTNTGNTWVTAAGMRGVSDEPSAAWDATHSKGRLELLYGPGGGTGTAALVGAILDSAGAFYVGATTGGAAWKVTAAGAVTAVSLALAGTITGATTIAATSTITGTALIASGLTGATAASRYVGATTSGAPASGTFAVGDYIVDQTGTFWICTTAGTPGTWTQVAGGSSSAPWNGTPVNAGSTSTYVVYSTAAATLDLVRDQGATITQAGDGLPGIRFLGNNTTGAGRLPAGLIRAVAEETWSGSASKARLEFRTNAGGASTTTTTYMALDNLGTLWLGNPLTTNTGGITAAHLAILATGTIYGGTLTISSNAPTNGSYIIAATGDATFATASAKTFTAAGQTGTSGSARLVGATTSGAPTGGGWSAGDFAVDQTGSLWVYSSSWSQILTSGAVLTLDGTYNAVTGTSGKFGASLTDDTNYPTLALRRRRVTAPGEVANTNPDYLGALEFQGWNNASSNHLPGAAILAQPTEDWSTTGFRGTQLVFKLGVNATNAVYANAMIVANTGGLYVGNIVLDNANNAFHANFVVDPAGQGTVSASVINATTTAASLSVRHIRTDNSGNLQSGDVIGNLSFLGSYAYAGTPSFSVSTGALIRALTTQAWTGSTVAGARLELRTTANSTSGTVIRLIIDQDGTVGVGNSTTGLGAPFHVTSAGDCSVHILGSAAYTICTADTTKTNNTNAAPTGFGALPVNAATYRVRMFIRYVTSSANATAGTKLNFTLAGGATVSSMALNAWCHDYTTIANTQLLTWTTTGNVIADNGTTLVGNSQTYLIFVEGIIVFSAAGTIAFNFAQNTTNAAGVQVLKGSTFQVDEVLG